MLKHLLKLETFLKLGVGFLLLAIPLYPKFPFIKIPGTYVSVRLEDFLIFILVIVVSMALISKFKIILARDIERSIFIFLAVTLVSVISAVFLTKTAPVHIALLHWIRRIEYFAPFFIGGAAIYFIGEYSNREKAIEFFVKCIGVAIIVAFLYGAGQKYLDWPVILTQNEEYSKGIALKYIAGSHISSTFAGHYDLATYLVLVIPIILIQLFSAKEIKLKSFYLLVFLSGLWLLASSISRISIVSYLIGSIVALVVAKKVKMIPLVLVISILFFGMSGDLLARYGRIIEVTVGKLQSIKVPKLLYVIKEVSAQEPKRIQSQTPKPSDVNVFEDRSTSIRLNIEWPRAIRAFTKNPLLGTGFSSITLATDNDFLRLLGEVGLFGFIAFILILLRIAFFSLKNMTQIRGLAGSSLAISAGVIGGFSGLLINALFIDVFEASKVAIMAWLLVGIYVQLIRSNKNEQ